MAECLGDLRERWRGMDLHVTSVEESSRASLTLEAWKCGVLSEQPPPAAAGRTPHTASSGGDAGEEGEEEEEGDYLVQSDLDVRWFSENEVAANVDGAELFGEDFDALADCAEDLGSPHVIPPIDGGFGGPEVFYTPDSSPPSSSHGRTRRKPDIHAEIPSPHVGSPSGIGGFSFPTTPSPSADDGGGRFDGDAPPASSSGAMSLRLSPEHAYDPAASASDVADHLEGLTIRRSPSGKSLGAGAAGAMPRSASSHTLGAESSCSTSYQDAEGFLDVGSLRALGPGLEDYCGDRLCDRGREGEGLPGASDHDNDNDGGGGFDTLTLRVVSLRGQTGLEEFPEFRIEMNEIVAGRYKVRRSVAQGGAWRASLFAPFPFPLAASAMQSSYSYSHSHSRFLTVIILWVLCFTSIHVLIAPQVVAFLGKAAFSRAFQAIDMRNGLPVCLKMINNNKENFDQGLDEIRMLRKIAAERARHASEATCAAEPGPNQSTILAAGGMGVVKLLDYFYSREHLFIVTELLKHNLYEFHRRNSERGLDVYFTMPRIQSIAKQVLMSLAFLHSMDVIHADIKPENILLQSYSKCAVKVIDLGSSRFIRDDLSNYIQSRSYRSPEVILGCPYDQKVREIARVCPRTTESGPRECPAHSSLRLNPH